MAKGDSLLTQHCHKSMTLSGYAYNDTNEQHAGQRNYKLTRFIVRVYECIQYSSI